MVNYTATIGELHRRTDEVFAWAASGQLDLKIGGRYPMDQVQAALVALEKRRTAGKLVLTNQRMLIGCALRRRQWTFGRDLPASKERR